MGCCPTKTVIKGLEAKGFRATRKTKHIIYVYHTTSGKRTPILTRISLGQDKDMPASLIALMSGQVKLKVSQFEALCKCPLSQAAYEEMLVSQNHI